MKIFQFKNFRCQFITGGNIWRTESCLPPFKWMRGATGTMKHKIRWLWSCAKVVPVDNYR